MDIYNGVADDYDFKLDTYRDSGADNIHTQSILDYLDIPTLKAPKTIATISVCGVIVFSITDGMNWTPPTEEQIKNLHDVFCIDVEILNKEQDNNDK